MSQEWSTVERAAPALGMSKQGIYDAIRKGQLPHEAVLRIGKRIRINLEALKKCSGSEDVNVRAEASDHEETPEK
jgi:excisionase family DNA binding protein